MAHRKDILEKALSLGLNHKQLDWCVNYSALGSVKRATKQTDYADGYGYVLLRKSKVKQFLIFLNDKAVNDET